MFHCTKPHHDALDSQDGLFTIKPYTKGALSHFATFQTISIVRGPICLGKTG